MTERPTSVSDALAAEGSTLAESNGYAAPPLAVPQNLEAEESVLGAMLISKSAIAAVSLELDAADFYRETHAVIYRTMLALDERGDTVDVITVADELAKRGKLEQAGSRVRLHELACLVPAASNAGHHARIVHDMATLRGLIAAGQQIAQLGWERPGETTKLVDRTGEILAGLRGRLNGGAPVDKKRLLGMGYAEARRAQIPPTNELVAGLIDAGTVGVVAGLPFARKTWAALEIAHKVAAGKGEVFGRCEVIKGGPVVYVWQDDSRPKELERIQLYANAHAYPDDLPLRFLLNEDVRLPDDIDALAQLIERDSAVLLVVDSLYNALAPTVKLKDEEVAIVLSQIKAGLCDRTGATAQLVDHAPWPTEGNRGQRRAYGSVFKTAAVRWSIHPEADAKDDTRLHVEASGNNVAGFRRTPARWDDETLEIRLLEPEPQTEEALDETVLAWVTEHPGEAKSKIAAGVGKRRENVAESLDRLGRLNLVISKTSRELGRPGTGQYWFPPNHAGSEASGNHGTAQDALFTGSTSEGEPSDPSHPRRGDGSRTGRLENDLLPAVEEVLRA